MAGRSPKRSAGQGASSWHAVSPGVASWPLGHASAGRIALHPPLPSGSKPWPHAPGGTPAGWHEPSSTSVSPGAHGISGGNPAGRQPSPESSSTSPGGHAHPPSSDSINPFVQVAPDDEG